MSNDGKWIIGLMITGFGFLGSNVIANDRIRSNGDKDLRDSIGSVQIILMQEINGNQQEILQRLTAIETKIRAIR